MASRPPERHRKRRIEKRTLGEARALTEPAFVKPADGRKGFEGAVHTGAADLPSAPPDDTPVLVADPVTWEIEVRCFILEGRVAGLYVAELLAEVDVPPAIVIDIGRIEGRGWAVVEANSAWGAGVDGCAPQRVLDVSARACIPRARLTPAGTSWAVTPVDLEAPPLIIRRTARSRCAAGAPAGQACRAQASARRGLRSPVWPRLEAGRLLPRTRCSFRCDRTCAK